MGRDAILAPLPGTHCDRIHLQIDILHPQPKGFHHPQAASIEQLDEKLGCAV